MKKYKVYRIPSTIDKRLLYPIYSEYMSHFNLVGLPIMPLTITFNIVGVEFYVITYNDKIVGFINGFPIDTSWYVSEIFIKPKHRYFFSTLIKYMNTILKSKGFNSWVTNPTRDIQKIFKRHNIAQEVKLCQQQ